MAKLASIKKDKVVPFESHNRYNISIVRGANNNIVDITLFEYGIQIGTYHYFEGRTISSVGTRLDYPDPQTLYDLAMQLG